MTITRKEVYNVWASKATEGKAFSEQLFELANHFKELGMQEGEKIREGYLKFAMEKAHKEGYELGRKDQRESIWLLTSEHNAYDQFGEYFIEAFSEKPTSEQIKKICQVNDEGAKHILAGGGRIKYEDQWYILREHKLPSATTLET